MIIIEKKIQPFKTALGEDVAPIPLDPENESLGFYLDDYWESEVLKQTPLGENQKLDKVIPCTIWNELKDGHQFEIGDRTAYLEDVQDVKEYVFYECMQFHKKQVDRQPDVAQSLWNKVTIKDDVEVWKQPIGGSGKYPYLDPKTKKPYVVSHKGVKWENRRQGINTSEPGTSDSGWLQISNTPAPWYNIGSVGYPLNWEVTHNGDTWKNTLAGNTYAPGVYGWTKQK